MARRFGRQSVVRAPRRRAQWSEVLVQSQVIALAAVQTFGAVNIGSAFLEQQTLVRLRGNARVTLDPGAAADTMIVGLGIGVVSEDAFAVGGVLSVPSPTDDADWSWIWHQLFVLGPTIGATPQEAGINQHASVVIDSKAQRKVGPNEVLFMVWDGIQMAGAPTADGVAVVRNLVLLA